MTSDPPPHLNSGSGRDAVLRGVAEAARRLFSNPNIDEAVTNALEAIALAIDIDRIYLFQYTQELPRKTDVVFCPYEWTAPGIARRTEIPGLFPISMEIFGDLFDHFYAGEWVQGAGDSLPDAIQQIAKWNGALSFLIIPIVVDEKMWGIIGFDDFHEERIWRDADIEVLKTASDCIGSAIDLDLARKTRESAAHARALELETSNQLLESRDRILEATAEAANVLLTADELDQACRDALRIIGIALETDRVGIAEHLEDLSNQSSGEWQVLYEWNMPVMIPVSQIYHPGSMRGSYQGAEALYEMHQKGDSFSVMTDEMQEPFRSSMTAVGVQLLSAVPILLNGHYWGTIVFADCLGLQRRSAVELSALKTVAECLGSAIQRDRDRQERDMAAQARSKELEAYNRQLQTRDNLLNCVNFAVQCLVATDNFGDALSTLLKILGEGTQQSRAYLLRISQDPQTHELSFNLDAEWDAPNIPKKTETGGRFPVPIDHFPPNLVDPLKCGKATQFLARELDGIPATERIIGQARSLLGVPITVAGEWWGLLGLDDCLEERFWSDVEISVLETAATAVGSAIERDQIRQAREAAERKALIQQERATRTDELERANSILSMRDRWLETTAAAANQLLSSADVVTSVNLALKMLGENLECDRLGVMRYFADANGLGTFRVLYEWNKTNTPSQMDDDELLVIPANDFADWTERLMQGESVGGLAVEQGDSFRTKLLALGTLSTYAVPIFVGVASRVEDDTQEEESFWGLMFIDYCHMARQLTPPELAVFNTAATCIGSTIYQDNVRHDREQAERTALLELEREQAIQARASQLQKSNEILSLRERWLDITATAANTLLLADDLDRAIDSTMQILGEGLDADRVGIMKMIEREGNRFYGMFAEWSLDEQPSQTEDEQLAEIPADLLGDRLNQLLMGGHWVGGAIDDDEIFPEALGEGLKAIGIQTSYSVPIFVSGQFWGVLGIDHCRDKRLLSETEIAVFKTIASCFGNAIQREQILQAREAAERTALIERERAARADELEATNQILSTRDRWLKATAAAANELLSATDVTVSVDAALKTIGQNLECDRLGVMKYVPGSPGLGRFHILYEWDSPQTRTQGSDPKTHPMLASDFELWSKQLMAGECVGGAVADLEEPFRSTMYELNVLSTYTVPIFFGTEFWGLMFMDDCQQMRQLTPAELAVFNTAASCVGSAIYQEQMRREREHIERNALLQQERQKATQQRVAELAQTNEALNRTLGTFANSPELDDFLGYLLAELAKQTGACTTHLFLYDEETHTLNQHCTVQEGQIYQGASPQDPDLSRYPIPADLTEGWQAIIESPTPLIFTRLNPSASASLSLCWPEMITWHRQQGHRTVVYLRLQVGNDPIGFIGFSFRRRAGLTREKVEFLQSLTHQATLAIQLTRLAEQNQNTALLDERNRLAREIHDTLAQAFTGISLQLEAAKGLMTRKPESAHVHIQRAGKLARRGLSEARRSVRALRSQALETDSLSEALQKNLKEATQDTDLKTQFQLQGIPDLLSEEIQLNLLRIGQEAITNTIRHAQAQNLLLTLTFSARNVSLRIVDDGCGFDTQSLIDVTGFGLVGIRERADRCAGELQILSRLSMGTTIEVTLPLEFEADNVF